MNLSQYIKIENKNCIVTSAELIYHITFGRGTKGQNCKVVMTNYKNYHVFMFNFIVL